MKCERCKRLIERQATEVLGRFVCELCTADVARLLNTRRHRCKGEIEALVVRVIDRYGFIDQRKLCLASGKAPRTANTLLSQMAARGVIRRIGEGRYGRPERQAAE